MYFQLHSWLEDRNSNGIEMMFVPSTSSTLILELLAQVSLTIASGYDARLAASGTRGLPVVERLLVRLAFFARVWLTDPDFVDIAFGISSCLKSTDKLKPRRSGLSTTSIDIDEHHMPYECCVRGRLCAPDENADADGTWFSRLTEAASGLGITPSPATAMSNEIAFPPSIGVHTNFPVKTTMAKSCSIVYHQPSHW